MQHRKFGELDWQASALGFGATWMDPVHQVLGEGKAHDRARCQVELP